MLRTPPKHARGAMPTTKNSDANSRSATIEGAYYECGHLRSMHVTADHTRTYNFIYFVYVYVYGAQGVGRHHWIVARGIRSCTASSHTNIDQSISNQLWTSHTGVQNPPCGQPRHQWYSNQGWQRTPADSSLVVDKPRPPVHVSFQSSLVDMPAIARQLLAQSFQLHATPPISRNGSYEEASGSIRRVHG
jgi:hypothetical protein